MRAHKRALVALGIFTIGLVLRQVRPDGNSSQVRSLIIFEKEYLALRPNTKSYFRSELCEGTPVGGRGTRSQKAYEPLTMKLMRVRFQQSLEDVTFRKRVAEEVRIGFELSAEKSEVAPCCTHTELLSHVA